MLLTHTVAPLTALNLCIVVACKENNISNNSNDCTCNIFKHSPKKTPVIQRQTHSCPSTKESDKSDQYWNVNLKHNTRPPPLLCGMELSFSYTIKLAPEVTCCYRYALYVVHIYCIWRLYRENIGKRPLLGSMFVHR